MPQRGKEGRRLALGFLRDHPVDALIASEPLGIAEDCAPALDRVLEAVGEEGVGSAQIHPGGCAALWWQLERVEHGSGRWVQHVGLIRVPLDLPVAQAADWLRLRILQIGDEAYLRPNRRCPVGADGALERAEECAEIGQLVFGEGLPTKYQYGVMCPQGAKLVDGLLVQRLPKVKSDDLASEAIIQQAGFQGHVLPPKTRH